MKAIKQILQEDNFLSLLGNLVIALLGVSGFALLARSLSLNDFGKWVLFITGGSFIEMFRFGITNNALIRFLSGADTEARTKLIGSNALIGLGATIIVSIILLSCWLLFHETIGNSGYELFFKWYPVLAFLNLPWNNALVVLQADREYGKILLLKSINSGSFFLVILYYFLSHTMSIHQLVFFLLLLNGLTSILTIILGWDGTKLIAKADGKTNKTLLNFGKYTTFTLIGTNLLRSADTIIISLSPLGSAAVALYSIPLKLTELQQIPLRSFVATAFPKMSKASLNHQIDEVKTIFYTYAGALSYLFIGLSIVTFTFAEYFVIIISGKKYLTIDPATGSDVVTIVKIFALYGLVLPIDRMTGICLDSINKPNKNAIKVFIMVVVNIIGDLIAIFIFKSLLLVAVASILFTLIGIWIGMYFLNQEMNLQYQEIFEKGYDFYKNLYEKIKNKSIQ